MPHTKVPLDPLCKSRTGLFFGVLSDRLPSQLKKLSAPKTSSKSPSSTMGPSKQLGSHLCPQPVSWKACGVHAFLGTG